MNDRFSEHPHHMLHRLSGILYGIFCLLLTCLFLYGLGSFGRDTMQRQQSSLENALRRDIAQCYAVEGIYPPSLAYLKEHYGLTYDTDIFYIDYQPIGSNLYPDVTVLNLKDPDAR